MEEEININKISPLEQPTDNIEIKQGFPERERIQPVPPLPITGVIIKNNDLILNQ